MKNKKRRQVLVSIIAFIVLIMMVVPTILSLLM